MEGDPRVGGVCGFLGLEDPPEYDEQIEIQTPHMLELEKMLDDKKKNKYKWQKKLEENNKAAQEKQEQKFRDQQQVVVNDELEEKKKTHFYIKHRN